MSDVPANNAKKVNSRSHYDAPRDDKKLTIKLPPAACHPSLSMTTAAVKAPIYVAPVKPERVVSGPDTKHAPPAEPYQYQPPPPPRNNDAEPRPPQYKKEKIAAHVPVASSSAAKSNGPAAGEKVKRSLSPGPERRLPPPLFSRRPLYTAELPVLKPGTAMRVVRSECHWRSANGDLHFTLSTGVEDAIPIDGLEEIPSTISRALTEAHHGQRLDMHVFEAHAPHAPHAPTASRRFVASQPTDRTQHISGVRLHDPQPTDADPQRPSEIGPQRVLVPHGSRYDPYRRQSRGPQAPAPGHYAPMPPPGPPPMVVRHAPPPTYAHNMQPVPYAQPQQHPHPSYTHPPTAHNVHAHPPIVHNVHTRPPIAHNGHTHVNYPPPQPTYQPQPQVYQYVRSPHAQNPHSNNGPRPSQKLTYHREKRSLYDAEGNFVAYIQPEETQ